MSHRRETVDKRSWRDFVPAAVLLVVGALGITAATLIPSSARGQYAVVAPPWYDLAQTVGLVAAADGDLVDLGGLTNIVVVHSAKPGFVRALYRAGAWLVMDPVLLRGCLGLDRKPAPVSGVT